LAINEFSGEHFSCKNAQAACERTGEGVLLRFGFSNTMISTCVLSLCILFIGFSLLAYSVLVLNVDRFLELKGVKEEVADSDNGGRNGLSQVNQQAILCV
jgi:hypothetical protein